MLKELDDYDWKYAFECCGEPEAQYNTASVSAVLDSEVSTEPFSRADVKKLIGLSLGENDGPDWLCAGQLKDGRWF